MEITFEVGDVVRLKSSDTLMTISSIRLPQGGGDFTYECLWFVQGVLHDAVFTHLSLKPICEESRGNLIRRMK